MALTPEQLRIAVTIDERMKQVLRWEGCDSMTILGEMVDYMANFKQLMDTSTPVEMNELCYRFPSFHRFAKVLEEIAEAFASSALPKMK